MDCRSQLDYGAHFGPLLRGLDDRTVLRLLLQCFQTRQMQSAGIARIADMRVHQWRRRLQQHEHNDQNLAEQGGH